MNVRFIVLLLAVSILALSLLACSTSATPKSCVEVARENGVPETVVELMERPHEDLNPLERIAIRTALNKVGVGDICAKFLEE